MPTVVEATTSVLCSSAGLGVEVLPLPTLFWRMNGAAGANEVDEIAGLTLTQVNGVGSAAGKVGNCRTFASASTQYLTAADTPALQLNVPSTIAGWYYLNTKTAFQLIIFKGSTGTDWSYELWFDQSNNTLRMNTYDGATGYSLPFYSNTPTGQWTSFCIEWTGTRILAAVNNQAFSFVSAPLPVATAGPFYLGAMYSNLGPLNGNLDSIAIWKGTVLSQNQYSLFHNNGNGRDFVGGAWT